MNNTAYNPLKKLLVMSIVLFAGTSAMAQQAAGSEMFGTTKPASMSTTPAVKQENANKATNPALSTATAKPGTNTKATATTRKQNAINASGSYCYTQQTVQLSKATVQQPQTVLQLRAALAFKPKLPELTQCLLNLI
jgi:hypothetical protein